VAGVDVASFSGKLCVKEALGYTLQDFNCPIYRRRHWVRRELAGDDAPVHLEMGVLANWRRLGAGYIYVPRYLR